MYMTNVQILYALKQLLHEKSVDAFIDQQIQFFTDASYTVICFHPRQLFQVKASTYIGRPLLA